MSAATGATSLHPLEPPQGPLQRIIEFEGASALGDVELLAVLLGPGDGGSTAIELAARLLEESGGLSGLIDRRSKSLSRLGIDAEQAARLVCAIELAERLRIAPTRIPAARPLDVALVAGWACPKLGPLRHEEVWVLCVDGRSALRSSFRVGRGGIHGCSLLPRDILGPVIREAASGFVLVHNHPSGDPNPSAEDIELTRAVSRAAALLGSPLLDHVVVAGSRHKSLLDLQLFEIL